MKFGILEIYSLMVGDSAGTGSFDDLYFLT